MRVLFFDIGYTLVNEDRVWAARCAEQAETAQAKLMGLSAQDIYRELEKASAAGLPPFRTVVNKYRFKETAPYRSELETVYPDAADVLETLSGRYQLGVIANQKDGLRERLESFGLLRFFTFIVSSWDVRVSNPDKRIFEYALQTADCPPECACMIGDRIDNDIAPAKAVGMETVWIRQGFGALQTPRNESEAPDHSISCLTDLLNIF